MYLCVVTNTFSEWLLCDASVWLVLRLLLSHDCCCPRVGLLELGLRYVYARIPSKICSITHYSKWLCILIYVMKCRQKSLKWNVLSHGKAHQDLLLTISAGLNRFCNDVELMIGYYPNWYWKINWVLISPALLVVSQRSQTFFPNE